MGCTRCKWREKRRVRASEDPGTGFPADRSAHQSYRLRNSATACWKRSNGSARKSHRHADESDGKTGPTMAPVTCGSMVLGKKGRKYGAKGITACLPSLSMAKTS